MKKKLSLLTKSILGILIFGSIIAIPITTTSCGTNYSNNIKQNYTKPIIDINNIDHEYLNSITEDEFINEITTSSNTNITLLITTLEMHGVILENDTQIIKIEAKKNDDGVILIITYRTSDTETDTINSDAISGFKATGPTLEYQKTSNIDKMKFELLFVYNKGDVTRTLEAISEYVGLNNSETIMTISFDIKKLTIEGEYRINNLNSFELHPFSIQLEKNEFAPLKQPITITAELGNTMFEIPNKYQNKNVPLTEDILEKLVCGENPILKFRLQFYEDKPKYYKWDDIKRMFYSYNDKIDNGTKWKFQEGAKIYINENDSQTIIIKGLKYHATSISKNDWAKFPNDEISIPIPMNHTLS